MASSPEDQPHPPTRRPRDGADAAPGSSAGPGDANQPKGESAMSRIDTIKAKTTLAIAAGVLALTSLAWADGDHNLIPPRLQKKDHFVRDAISRMAYAVPYETTLVATCDCLEPVCEG